jgi:methylated-DNA-[protein]-cysteine S-methyltransferase
MKEIPYIVFQTRLGWMGLVEGEEGVRRIYLPEPSRADLLSRIYREFPGCREGSELLDRARAEIIEYFDGKRNSFDMPLDLSSATPFQRKVYRAMKAIPPGKIHTYRWLAGEIGNPKGLRAVGSANARNRWPLVIPCHRIVGSDGRLTGFSAPGGLDLKADLLKLEGILVEQGRAKPIAD